MAFTLPEDGVDFTDRVYARVLHLIETGIWDIRKERFNGWRAQFELPVEKFFAACILDSMIYRSRAQFEAGILALYRGDLRWACERTLPGDTDLDLANALREKTDPGVRLVPVICDSDPPSKSGPSVMRHVQRLLRVRNEWMIWPWQVKDAIRKDKVKHFILVDDFLGSGRQFLKFVERSELPIADDQVHWIYAPIVAHDAGVIKIHEKYACVDIVSAEQLNTDHGFFSDATWRALTNGTVTPIDAKDFYIAFVKKYKAGAHSVPPLGFGELALCFGFAHSTPNNSLPILWADEGSWAALLDR